MRWQRLLLGLWLGGWLFGRLLAADYSLIDGSVLKGELVASDENGFVIRLENGTYSPRTDWGKLTDESLAALANNPKVKRFVEPFLAPPPLDVKRNQPRPMKASPPANLVSRPTVKAGLGTTLMTPGGLLFLGALFVANLYVGFEVARFKWRPAALVCGVSAVLPVVGPLIFLALPKNVPVEEAGATEEALAQQQLTVAESGPSMVQQMTRGAKAGGEELPKVFRRGEFTFNRRFFETQFPNFFRVVASEAEKDLVLDIQCARGPVLAKRISRISANEMAVKTVSEAEVPVEFAGITEIRLRHKDAP